MTLELVKAAGSVLAALGISPGELLAAVSAAVSPWVAIRAHSRRLARLELVNRLCPVAASFAGAVAEASQQSHSSP